MIIADWVESNSVCDHTSAICLIRSTITNRIGRQEVPFPIIHDFYNKICDISGFFLIKTQEIAGAF